MPPSYTSAQSATPPLALIAQVDNSSERPLSIRGDRSDDPEGEFDPLEGDENLDDDEKARRRLVQNREAARKSRQRRKQYVQKLEEEVGAHSRAPKPTANVPYPGLVPVLSRAAVYCLPGRKTSRQLAFVDSCKS